MQVQIWNSFSCNNSSDYRLVARFGDAKKAAKAAKELETFFQVYAKEFDKITRENDYEIPEHTIPTAAAFAKAHGIKWDSDDILAWGDEGLTNDLPHVAVVGKTLSIYHTYCGGFTSNIPRALKAAGAEVEDEVDAAPQVSVRLTLKPGQAGEKLASQLAKFFAKTQVNEPYEVGRAPWGKAQLQGESDDIAFYREGSTFAFKAPMHTEALAPLKAFLAKEAKDFDLRLCDEREIGALEMRDTILDLEARVASGERITELDLSHRKLRFVPPQVFGLSELRRLDLSNNPLKELPKELAKLKKLEALDVETCELRDFPALALPELRELDVSDNPFKVVPKALLGLPKLRKLEIRELTGTDLAGLGKLTRLEELSISLYRTTDDDDDEDYEDEDDEGGKKKRPRKDPNRFFLPFPRAILKLTKLRRLDVGMTALTDVPNDLLRLKDLEELELGGSLGRVKRLPALEKLRKLRVLGMSGGAVNSRAYPQHALLSTAFKVGTLEEFAIDRYGKETGYNKRPALTKLPPNAFSKMKGLRKLDLSFTEIQTLPESFYKLERLESVNFEYTHLTDATLKRLVTTFPKVRLELRNLQGSRKKTKSASEVRKLAQKGSDLASDGKHAEAVKAFEKALGLCKPGKRVREYDHLYALYGAVDAIGHLRLKAKGPEREKLTERCLAYAERALGLVPAMIFHFTDEGAFQEEVIRRCGNAVAWILMEKGELDRALSTVERALGVGGDRGYIFDTKVRILLKAKRIKEAYTTVDGILAEDPQFGDFQDIKASKAYKDWVRGGRK